MFATFNSSKKMSKQNLETENSQTKKETENSQTTEDTQETSQNNGDENIDNLSEGEVKEQIKKLNDKNSQLYERTKKAEAQKKKLEAKLESMKRNPTEKKEDKIENMDSVFEQAKKLNSLKDYSSDELDIIERQAKALDLDPVEAAKHEDVKTLIEAKRKKKEKINNTPSPSNKQQPSSKSFSDWTPEDISKIDSSTEEGIEKLDEYRRWARKN